jgi:integrase/recombinase XerD
MIMTSVSVTSPSQLLNEYRLNLEALNRSPKTVTWYLAILSKYFAFLASNQLLKPLQQLGTAELRAYILHLQQTTRWANSPHIKKTTGKLSPFSIQGEVRAIKAFWSYLEHEGYLERNPLAKFPLPKVPQKPIQAFTWDQIKILLYHIDKNSAVGAKYYTIILILLDSGVRISELTNLKIQDLDLQHNCLRVMGKGQKLRTVPISAPTRKQLNHYLNNTRPFLCHIESLYVFPTNEGTPISSNSVQQFLRRLANKADINGIRCSPHTFRHTFATLSIAGGGNLFTLKEIMGHRALATTQKYVHLQPEQLQLQHAQFSPVVNLARQL